MDTVPITLFLSLLTLAAHIAAGGALVLSVAGRRWPAVTRIRALLAAGVARDALPLALLVALTATGGSLYLSEVVHLTPCKLCWYQRAALYPLVPMLAIAAWRRDLAVRPYALALALAGLPIAAYHYLLQLLPALEIGSCDPAASCTVAWVWRFHYISIPLMAATAFTLIALLLLLAGTPADVAKMVTPSPTSEPAPEARRVES
jgi:disulfide bond formation protein DsbB